MSQKPLTLEEIDNIIKPKRFCDIECKTISCWEGIRPTYFLQFISLLNDYAKNRDNNFSIAEQTVANIMNIHCKTVMKLVGKAKELNIIKITAYKWFENSKYPTNVYKIDYDAYNAYMASVDQSAISSLVEFEEEDFAKVFKKMGIYRKKRNILFDALSDGVEVYNKEDVRNVIKQYERKALEKKERELREAKERHKKYIDLKEEVEDYGLGSVYLGENKKRLYNRLCSTRNERNPYSSRPKVLKENLGFDSFIEHDTNASIHRVIYAMNHGGKSLSRDVDVYEIVAKDSGLLKEGEEFTKEMREAIKLPMQCLQFRERAIGFWSSNYYHFSRTHSFKSCKERDMFENFERLCKAYDCEVEYGLRTLAEAMHRFYDTDKFMGADVFYYESDIHLLVLKKFQSMGIKVINVYDGFYFDANSGVTKDMFYDAIEEACITVFNDVYNK